MPSFFEIFLFELAIEIIKHCTVKTQAKPRSEIETSVSFDPLSLPNDNSGVPLVRSVMIYRICQALELEAILAISNDINPEMTKPRNVKRITPSPVVYSVTLSKMCEALDLKVELRPENERPFLLTKKGNKFLWFILPQSFAFAKHCNSMHSWQTPQSNRQKYNIKTSENYYHQNMFIITIKVRPRLIIIS
ncbi:hypothetical protein TNCT_442281 [Trichonephila clavata]|uniref:Uncharacterized protein n=1 Tax=Trichonephila clavata TaxID=2740835 RepID=A0A8X6HQF8_TRICU|nr:hypothetical protein TNCT_442281 [Trichonephila clavata]